MDHIKKIETLKLELYESQVSVFSNHHVLALGLQMVKEAEYKQYLKAIGSERWIIKKQIVGKRFGISFLCMRHMLEKASPTFNEPFALSEDNYAFYGRSFPLIISGKSMFGTIPVCILAAEENYQFVVDMIRKI